MASASHSGQRGATRNGGCCTMLRRAPAAWPGASLASLGSHAMARKPVCDHVSRQDASPGRFTVGLALGGPLVVVLSCCVLLLAGLARAEPTTGPAVTGQVVTGDAAAEASRLVARLPDPEQRGQAFRRLFELQARLGRTAGVSDAAYGQGRLIDHKDHSPGYLVDDRSGAVVINSVVAFPCAISARMDLPCWFLFDKNGQLLAVRINETVTEMMDADRDGTLKLLAVQEYPSPLAWDDACLLWCVHRVTRDQLQIEMTVRTDVACSMRFGESRGAGPVTVEVRYGGLTRPRAVYSWDPKARVYTGPLGNTMDVYRVVTGSKFAAGAGDLESEWTAKKFATQFSNFAERHAKDWRMLAARLMALWHEPSLAAKAVEEIVPLLSEECGQAVPTIAAGLLGRLGYRDAVEPLAETAFNPKRWQATRGVAIWALSRLGDKENRPELERLAGNEDESETIRVAAMRALAILASDPATVAAENALSDPTNRQADEAAMAWWSRTTGTKLGTRPEDTGSDRAPSRK